MKPTLLPCVLALLAWPAATTKTPSAATPEQLRGSLSLLSKSELSGSLILLSKSVQKVKKHQTPFEQEDSKNDAETIARLVKANSRTGLRKLLLEMQLQGGQERISDAMAPLLTLGYRREDVYHWLKDGVIPPPEPITEENVEVQDDENPPALTRTQAQPALEDVETAEIEQVGDVEKPVTRANKQAGQTLEADDTEQALGNSLVRDDETAPALTTALAKTQAGPTVEDALTKTQAGPAVDDFAIQQAARGDSLVRDDEDPLALPKSQAEDAVTQQARGDSQAAANGGDRKSVV